MMYSIIIPHYNIPDLLRRCLESIPQRDDVQVIVVDDCGSADNRRKLKNFEGSCEAITSLVAYVFNTFYVISKYGMSDDYRYICVLGLF